jgi:hypothetical protein
VLLYSKFICHGARLLEQRMWTILRSCRRSTPTAPAQPLALPQRAEATKVFYAGLSPVQKKVFDAETAPRQHARHHGGRGLRCG